MKYLLVIVFFAFSTSSFAQLSYSNYTETYVGTPTNTLLEVQNELNKRYNENSNKLNTLVEMITIELNYSTDSIYKEELSTLLIDTYLFQMENADLENKYSEIDYFIIRFKMLKNLHE